MGSPAPAWQPPTLTEDYVRNLKKENKAINYTDFGIGELMPTFLTDEQLKNPQALGQGYEARVSEEMNRRRNNEETMRRRSIIDQQYQTLLNTVAAKDITASAQDAVAGNLAAELSATQLLNQRKQRGTAVVSRPLRSGAAATLLTGEAPQTLGGKTLLGL